MGKVGVDSSGLWSVRMVRGSQKWSVVGGGGCLVNTHPTPYKFVYSFVPQYYFMARTMNWGVTSYLFGLTLPTVLVL